MALPQTNPTGLGMGSHELVPKFSLKIDLHGKEKRIAASQ